MAQWDGKESSCSCDCGFDIPKGGHLDTLTVGDIKGIADLIYPVGSIYISVNYTNPGTLFGGTWKRIYNRFLLGAGSLADGTQYLPEDTGGESEQSFSVSHEHVAPIGYKSGGAMGVVQINSYKTSGSGKRYRTVDIQHGGDSLSENVTMPYTSTEKVSATIPTMPPYFVVCIWQRTA